MKCKRGIFCGTIVMIGSFRGIYEMYLTKGMGWLYVFALFLGIIQLMVSFDFQKPYKKTVLLACFGLEGIYYMISIVYLLISKFTLGEKIFGTIVGIFMLTLIISSIYGIKRNQPSDTG